MEFSRKIQPAPHSTALVRVAKWAAWIVLLLAPLAVFHEVLFGGFTFSYSTFACDPGRTSGDIDTLPVLDPGAAAAQDESWLMLIRRTLLTGELPVVNMNNGLGAPLLESLQSGAWYPPNLVLRLLPGDSPWCFDLFVLLHIELLLAGLFVLLRLYARLPIALVLALVIGLSGVTYQHLDMVHYRSFNWLPWQLAAAVHVARGAALVVVAQAEQVAPLGWPARLEKFWTPHEAEVLARAKRRPRVLTSLPPNQNALIGIESISLFDPVH